MDYLNRRPAAQDTFQGIVEWWLLEQRVRCVVADTREALAELVARGLVLVREGPDGQSYYEVNRAKLKSIRALLGRNRQNVVGHQ